MLCCWLHVALGFCVVYSIYIDVSIVYYIAEAHPHESQFLVRLMSDRYILSYDIHNSSSIKYKMSDVRSLLCCSPAVLLFIYMCVIYVYRDLFTYCSGRTSCILDLKKETRVRHFEKSKKKLLAAFYFS